MLDATDLVHAFLTREAKEGGSSENEDGKVARDKKAEALVQKFLLEAKR